MTVDEALWLGAPVAHVAAYRERQRLARKLELALRAMRENGARQRATSRAPLGCRLW